MFYLTAIIGITIPYGKIYWKKMKAIDNIELDTRNKLQKLKFLLWDGSLKSVNIFSKYINGNPYNSSARRVKWLCVIFWGHYEMRENNHANLTARSVHSYKLTATTKHFWGKKYLLGKKPTSWIKLDIKIKFCHTYSLFRLNPGARCAISHTCLPCIPST